MKTLLKITGLCTILVVLLNSCNSDDRKKAKIQKLLTENNFTEARILNKEISSSFEMQTVAINRAEISFYVKQNEFARAKAVALENNEMDMYEEAAINWFPTLIEKKEYEMAVELLNTLEITDHHTSLSYKPIGPINEEREYKENIGSANWLYNEGVAKYNERVFILFNSALMDNNLEYVKKSLLLFKPEMTMSSKKAIDNRWVRVYYKQDNKALQQAKIKLAEQNIKVD
ncbi:MAG: hypothetical protein J6W37_04705 [Bacteroidales bacterium]|nr:hypothetical protein [Bacteroidales bacterium]